MSSPLFKEYFENKNWKLIYFDAFRIEYPKEKEKTNILGLIRKKNTIPKKASIVRPSKTFFKFLSYQLNESSFTLLEFFKIPRIVLGENHV